MLKQSVELLSLLSSNVAGRCRLCPAQFLSSNLMCGCGVGESKHVVMEARGTLSKL